MHEQDVIKFHRQECHPEYEYDQITLSTIRLEGDRTLAAIIDELMGHVRQQQPNRLRQWAINANHQTGGFMITRRYAVIYVMRRRELFND
jgi:hypothetical protein